MHLYSDRTRIVMCDLNAKHCKHLGITPTKLSPTSPVFLQCGPHTNYWWLPNYIQDLYVWCVGCMFCACIFSSMTLYIRINGSCLQKGNNTYVRTNVFMHAFPYVHNNIIYLYIYIYIIYRQKSCEVLTTTHGHTVAPFSWGRATGALATESTWKMAVTFNGQNEREHLRQFWNILKYIVITHLNNFYLLNPADMWRPEHSFNIWTTSWLPESPIKLPTPKLLARGGFGRPEPTQCAQSPQFQQQTSGAVGSDKLVSILAWMWS